MLKDFRSIIWIGLDLARFLPVDVPAGIDKLTYGTEIFQSKLVLKIPLHFSKT